MDRRTYESPMEWEYQDQRGPLDATSPFSHVAKSQATRIDFSSPSKFSSSRPNPFASSPSKPLPPLPQTSLFSPRIQHSSTAPPFRNPAFTTPRKPFDETLFSEAESSPALTEASDLPNDTPDFFFFGILLLCLGLNAWSHVQIGTSAKAVHPVPSNAAADVGHHPQPSGFPGDSAQAYMWVPIQTPSHRRQLDFDADGTDTDGASPPFRKAILPPPQTPSRRSPSKGDYSRSPVKYGRSPSKGY
ncbi:hypothetical protein BN1723_009674 [Verticillium longisporum]|uniref:Uncharacterized protein n=1 Tax=Verticillium longisporum TaxID=100787 RepID=A0A0G4KR94_VERLO|nr:hypothetical protein BN1723_009674 [Verticillium longisporum]